MVALTLRNVKGSELTFQEVDDNFSNLDAGKGDVGTILGTSTTGSGQINATNLATTDAKAVAAFGTDFSAVDSSGDIVNWIEAQYPGDFTSDQKAAIEMVIRPLYCMMSVLLKNLDDQGIA